MPRTGQFDPSQLTLCASWDVLRDGSGGYRLVPQPPRVKCSVAEAVKQTGMKRDNLYKLIDAEMIEFEKPSPRKTLVFLDSVRAFLKDSQDPDFWTAERRLRYYGKK